MDWKPSNQPTRINRVRAEQIKPIQEAIQALGLPSLRERKLNPIANALAMQIEDGGDHPQVNQLLVDALRAGIRHQVDETTARPALDALAAFERAETEYWEQVRAGTYRPPALSPSEQFEEWDARGIELNGQDKTAQACDCWLSAWELLKTIWTPDLRSLADFERAHPEFTVDLGEFCFDLMFELHNAGVANAVYHQKRLEYASEFLEVFPDSDAHTTLEFMRAQGEALWELGRPAESDQLYAELIARLPDQGWGYIGWSDQYWIMKGERKDYARAEEILRRALARPALIDRDDVSRRLRELIEARDGVSFKNLGRNDPCWCGSGKKYKQCHLRTDTKESR
jgi:tetratricopeptide (TPR) repeat protein